MCQHDENFILKNPYQKKKKLTARAVILNANASKKG